MDWTKSTRDMHSLTSDMFVRVLEVIDKANEHGLDIVPLESYRDPWSQARLFRKTRTRDQIREKQDSLEARGYPRLAYILDQVGPQQGPLGQHVTYVGPGESWHQFGEAWDSCPMFDGKRLLWDIEEGSIEWCRARIIWATYGDCIRNAGLVWGGDWDHFKDRPHAQFRGAENPLVTLSPDEVNEWGIKCNWWR